MCHNNKAKEVAVHINTAVLLCFLDSSTLGGYTLAYVLQERVKTS